MAVTNLARWSAPFGPGVINADGLRKLLGASDHDALSLLVRETIQNSWDASRDHSGRPLLSAETPYYGLSLRTLTSSQHRAIRDLLGGGVPGLPTLDRALAKPGLRVLEIADRHTSGLGGPLDNRQSVEHGERTDFVDLVFNIGAPQDTDLGGGTFGFGKIATYAMSAAATVVIVSRPLEKAGTPGPLRLIASAIGDAYSENGIRYTGRHWWGVHGEGTVLPVVGHGGDRLAAEAFESFPSPDVSGTTIMVIDPDLDGLPRHGSEREAGLNPAEAAHRMVSALLWSAWPKLVPSEEGGEPPMLVAVSLDGDPHPIPDPPSTHPFIGFSHALQIVRREQSREVPDRRAPHGLERRQPSPRYVRREAYDNFETSRPGRLVGVAAVAESLNVPGTASWQGDRLVAESMGVTGDPRHLALMRRAELVVRYDEGPEHPDASASMSWGGVFRTELDVDAAFAESEPPTHDRWVAGGLGRPRSTFVRLANKRGPTAFYERIFSPAADDGAVPAGDLARLVTTHLSGLFDEGEAPTRKRSARGGGGKASGISVNASKTEILDGRQVVVVEFDAPNGTVVKVGGRVALAGGGHDRETTVPTLGFSPPDGSRPVVEGDTFRSDGTPLLAWLAQPSDATVRVTIDRVG